jgi:hypothetical protein
MPADAPSGGERPRGLIAWLKHAFAVERYDESSLNADDKEILERLAQRIHEKRMTAPAILWAESHRYLNFLGSQVLVMLQPIFDLSNPFLNMLLGRFGIHISPEDYRKLFLALEKRYSVEYFIQQLEAHAAAGYNKNSAKTRAAADASEPSGAAASANQTGRQREDQD